MTPYSPNLSQAMKLKGLYHTVLFMCGIGAITVLVVTKYLDNLLIYKGTFVEISAPWPSWPQMSLCVQIFGTRCSSSETDAKEPVPSWRQRLLDRFNMTHFDCSREQEEIKAKRLTWKNVATQLKYGPRAKCQCTGFPPLPPTDVQNLTFYRSYCGPDADAVGAGQNVISFCLFKPKKFNKISKDSTLETRYVRGVKLNLDAMKRLYPGWVMRVYTDMDLKGEMCDLACLDKDLYLCPVNPKTLPTLLKRFPMIWRFLVLGDLTVNKFAVRDLDSVLTTRERLAVAEWETSQFPFHAMRDHAYHGTEIMGGMWGGDNSKLCFSNGQNIMQDIFGARPLNPNTKGFDQAVISYAIYGKYKKNILVHDSYLCEKFKDSLPFPSQRPGNLEYVGEPATERLKDDVVRFYSLQKPCPITCRPTYGANWTYC